MTKLVSIQTASRPLTQEDIAFMLAHHREVIGDAASPPEILFNPNDPTQIAIVGDVHDREKLRERSRSEAACRLQEQRGVSMKQLFYFLEA